MEPGARGGRPGVVEGLAAPTLVEESEDLMGVEVGVEVGEGPLAPLEEGRPGVSFDGAGLVTVTLIEDRSPVACAVCGRRVEVGVVGGRRLLAVPGRVSERVGVSPGSCAFLEGPKRTEEACPGPVFVLIPPLRGLLWLLWLWWLSARVREASS